MIEQRQRSEDVIINAPMSYAGAAQRSWRLRRRNVIGKGLVAKTPVTLVVVLLIVFWWGAITLWYLSFGLLLIPYRLLRRGARKRKQEALRHREVMAALEEKRH